MSQKEVKLYDDSVIKLTIKQGTEKERFPVTIGSGQFTKEDDLLNFDKINSVSGALVSGELGYTRDTHRLFVGNISESLNGLQQQTLGGTLAGNKYLGFVDSRDTSNLTNSAPLPLEELLNSSSIYRSYNFSDDGSEHPVITEDKKWQRLPYYNSAYDAYDGDYMYDMYRNAIILFDHNINSANNPSLSSGKLVPTMRGKRKTIFESRFDGKNLEGGEKTVNSHTKDMYGDGYVLFYNVIPDGDTLTFADKSFDKNGKDNNEADANNYSYNIIKLNKVPPTLLKDALDGSHFALGTGGTIQLNSDIVDKLNTLIGNNFTSASSGQLIKIIKGEDDVITLANTNIKDSDLSWITSNLSSTKLKDTIINQVLTPNEYVTKNDVNTIVAGAINGADANININVEIPIPDFTASKTLTSNTISVSSLKTLFGYESDDEASGTSHFLLIGGTGEMEVTHSYKSDVDNEGGTATSQETVSGETTFGKTAVYSELLIPFKLDKTDETLTLSGSGISKKVIIPEK